MHTAPRGLVAGRAASSTAAHGNRAAKEPRTVLDGDGGFPSCRLAWCASAGPSLPGSDVLFGIVAVGGRGASETRAAA